MKTINGNQIQLALQDIKRVYLCGKQLSSQAFKHIENEGLEIGISDYKEFTADVPHIHTSNDEYNIVLAGEVKVYVFEEKKEYVLGKDGVFLIEPHMPYMVKAKAGTQVLFVKSPGGNDKQLLPITSPIEHWMNAWENTMNE